VIAHLAPGLDELMELADRMLMMSSSEIFCTTTREAAGHPAPHPHMAGHA
jgi:hypothetical protein